MKNIQTEYLDWGDRRPDQLQPEAGFPHPLHHCRALQGLTSSPTTNQRNLQELDIELYVGDNNDCMFNCSMILFQKIYAFVFFRALSSTTVSGRRWRMSTKT